MPQSRAKIERQYAEDLVRLGKTAAGKDEIGYDIFQY